MTDSDECSSQWFAPGGGIGQIIIIIKSCWFAQYLLPGANWRIYHAMCPSAW